MGDHSVSKYNFRYTTYLVLSKANKFTEFASFGKQTCHFPYMNTIRGLWDLRLRQGDE